MYPDGCLDLSKDILQISHFVSKYATIEETRGLPEDVRCERSLRHPRIQSGYSCKCRNTIRINASYVTDMFKSTLLIRTDMSLSIIKSCNIHANIYVILV